MSLLKTMIFVAGQAPNYKEIFDLIIMIKTINNNQLVILLIF